MLGTKKWIKRKISTFWLLVYRSQNKFSDIKFRYGKFVFYMSLISFLICISILLFAFQNGLNNYYSTKQEIEGLRALILTVGSALIGASVIVTSLVLFVMQVNIERIPHGLFRKLSDDWKLLGTFALTFFLAMGVTTLSTFINQTKIIFIVLYSFWTVAIILILFQYAYRRALFLISPLEQIGILKTHACKELRNWDKKAQRISPLLEQERSVDTTSSSLISTHDSARTVFFMKNKQGENGAKRALRHAMSLAQRYAEQGDYEVSKSALDVIIVVNAAYIAAKGKTFYADNPFIEQPLANDNFINHTLESLRQNVQAAISRRDEQQIEQTLRTMAALYQMYLGIDYSGLHITKSHANIAAGYLTTAIQDVIPHDMPDVLLEGQRLMGQSAQQLFNQGNPDDIAILSEKIALISYAGIAKENYRPVTMEGIQQLANLTFCLLRSKSHHIRSAVREIRRNVAFVVELFLHLPDTSLARIHSYYLGPYYSSTNTQSLRTRLTILGHAIIECDQDNDDAKTVIGNIEQWADGMYKTEKDLLLTAIKARSTFTSDMIYWIIEVTEILLAISNASACDDYHKQKIRDHGRWLIRTLSWIPVDEDTLIFVENFGMTEKLFEATVIAQKRDCNEISRQIAEMLLSWAFKAGRYPSGSEILKRGLCGLAAFALIGGDKQVSAFKNAVAAKLLGEFAPAQEIRDNAAKRIFECATSLYKEGHWSSKIDMAIDQANHEQLQPLLKEIAALLAPNAIQQ